MNSLLLTPEVPSFERAFVIMKGPEYIGCDIQSRFDTPGAPRGQEAEGPASIWKTEGPSNPVRSNPSQSPLSAHVAKNPDWPVASMVADHTKEPRRSDHLETNSTAFFVGASKPIKTSDLPHGTRDATISSTTVQSTPHPHEGPSSKETKATADHAANPHQLRSNRYHGSQSFANYGWVNINEQWVDPDGEADVDSAWRGIFTYEASKVTFPEGVRSARVLSDTELKVLYKDFEDFVSDDEGNPDLNHITPEDFIAMARGAKKGYRHELEAREDIVSYST